MNLFRHFIETYKQFGEFNLHTAKTRIALACKIRFCAINRICKDFIDGHLVLPEKYDKTHCFYKIDVFGRQSYVHHFRLYIKNDITEELKGFMKKAYIEGQREIRKNKLNHKSPE